jgi:hypothetical protein
LPIERERQQQTLDRDVAVASLFRDLLGGIEHARSGRGQNGRSGAAAGDFRHLRERGLYGQKRFARIAPGPIDQARRKPFRIVEQHLKQVLGRELRMPFAQRQRLGGLNESLGAVGIFLKIHKRAPSASSPVLSARSGHAHWESPVRP